MNYYKLHPEVAGGWGENIVVDRSVHPPLVDKLHYEFDGWPEDELISSFPIFIITEGLKDRLLAIFPTGCLFDDVETSKSEQYLELHPGMDLPSFVWLKVIGTAGEHDFGIAKDLRLVVSEKALTTLKEGSLKYCDIYPYTD